MSIRLDEIKDPRTRKRIEDALGAGSQAKAVTSNPNLSLGPGNPGVAGGSACPSSRPHLSTDEAKLNKTERAFLQWLRQTGNFCIGIQNVTLKLADDCRYTCDFTSLDGTGLRFWEVKGHWRDDARVKIKVAARMFPWARFTAVQRVKGQWQFEEIKP